MQFVTKFWLIFSINDDNIYISFDVEYFMKLSKQKREELQKDWKKHNKTMKQKHFHDMVFVSFSDYLSYRFGEKSKKTQFKEYTPPKNYRTETKIHSLSDSNELPKPNINTCKPKNPTYSGSYVVGIATMHKSNLVAVGKEDDPENYSKMRRNG